MLKSVLLLCLVSLLTVAASAADLRPLINRDAAKYARAWERNNYPEIAALTPPRVVQASGGRAALIADLKSKFSQARDLGAKELEATPGAPTPPRQYGQWLVSMLPFTAVIHGSHVALTQETHALAVSGDRGRKWSFVLLFEITQEDLDAWFPEFRGKIAVPNSSAPRVDVVY